MERLERFYKIEQLLKGRKVVSFSALQSSLGISRATLKRDLEYMQNRFNAPIEYDRETNGYRFGKPRTSPRYELPGLWTNVELRPTDDQGTPVHVDLTDESRRTTLDFLE